MGIVVVSPSDPPNPLLTCDPAKSGAGGNGLIGLPPYLLDGVPGRGLPLMSAGSYAMIDGGRLEELEEVRDGDDLEGVYDRAGDALLGE